MSEPEAMEPRRVSYGSIVWAELARNRVAMVGLGAVVAFFVLAIYAPLIAIDQPLVWIGAEGVRFP